MSELYGKIGESNPTYLLADPTGAEKVAVSVKPDEGTLERGTVLYRGTDNLYAKAAAANVSATNYLVVLDEDVTIAAGTTVAPVANAYRAGRLVRSRVKVGDTKVTAAQEVILRGQGIVLSNLMEEAEEITNTNT